jgi:hypothetical protein
VSSRARVVAVFSLAALVECGGVGDAVRAPTTTVVVPVAPPSHEAVAPLEVADPLAEFVGPYRITGEARSDSCAGVIVLAANAIDVAATGHLHANVVNRDYEARVEGERLVAEGRFPASTGCDGDIFERWTFEPSAGGLEGELESEWPLPPSCSSHCRVVFAIHATRAGGGRKPKPAPR